MDLPFLNQSVPAADFKQIMSSLGFPGGSDGKESACNVEAQVQSLRQEDPLKKEIATQSSTLA